MIHSLNRPQRERLPCFEAGISVVKKVKLTVVTETGERFVFSEGEGVEYQDHRPANTNVESSFIPME